MVAVVLPWFQGVYELTFILIWIIICNEWNENKSLSHGMVLAWRSCLTKLFNIFFLPFSTNNNPRVIQLLSMACISKAR